MKQNTCTFQLILIKTILTLFILFSISNAQTEEWVVFDSLNSPLKTNVVLSLEHDKYANIWIGTEYGLFKFDSYFWKLYDTANSGLASNEIGKIVLDTQSNLWFSANHSYYPYFIKYDGSSWIKTDTNQTCIEQMYHNQDFAVEDNGAKWVYGKSAQPYGQIIRIDEDSCSTFSPGTLNLGLSRDYTVAPDNSFWFCTEYGTNYSGIAKYSNSSWQIHYVLISQFVIDTTNSIVWYGTPWGLEKIRFNDLSTLGSYSYPSGFGGDHPKHFYLDNNFNPWYASSIEGIFEFDHALLQYAHFSKSNSELPSDTVSAIAVDSLNNIWLGTSKGLAVLNETGLLFKPSISNKDTLDFGVVLLNDTLSQSFIISNPLPTNIIIDSIFINSTVFNYIGSLPITIEPGNSEEFTVDFTPDSLNEYKCKLILHTNKGMKSILLTGVCDIPPFAANGIEGLNEYKLSQNYPNPFNPVTTIKYQFPERGFVTLKVYDVLGNEVATLVNEEKPAGGYEVEWNASDLPSGIYFYRMRAGNFIDTKKLILLK